MKIGIILRGMSELKVLQPIMEYLCHLKVQYFLFVPTERHGSVKKRYNVLSVDRINMSSRKTLDGAEKTITFNDLFEVVPKIEDLEIEKLLMVEAPRFRKFLSSVGKTCRIYSISYFSDSCFKKKNRMCVDDIRKIYHTTSHCMRMFHKFYDMEFDQNRDMLLGSPLFDCLPRSNSKNGIILFAPNLYEQNLPATFGTPNKMARLIRKIMREGSDSIIIKSRWKQYLPKRTKNEFRNVIYYDGGIMYPTVSSKLFAKSSISMMFYSSTIYEAIFAGQYVINCHINFGRWKTHEKVRDYMTPLYKNVDGLIENITMNTIANRQLSFKNKQADPQKAQEWIENFIMPEIITDSYKRIVDDFLAD